MKSVKKILHHFFSIVAILSLLVASTSKGLIVIAYYANKDFIAKTLCENKDKPELKCKGKCHLNKDLQKEEKQSSTQGTSLKEVQEISPYISVDHYKHDITSSSLRYVSLCLCFSQLSLASDIFHPPNHFL